VFKQKLAKGVYSYLDSLERIEIRGTPLVDVENLLGIPDHSCQVAGQHNLNKRKGLILK
jgi:hypothetical protein